MRHVRHKILPESVIGIHPQDSPTGPRLDSTDQSPSPGPGHRPKRAVTMADVAARVGVSKMTVSRALKRSDSSDRSSSEALRQRILAACDEMGYVIDQTARTFSTKRSGFVAALIPSLNNSNFSETAQGLTAAVEASGLQLLLGCLKG